MRQDEKGNWHPATLREYLGCVEDLAPDSEAARYLGEEIQKHGPSHLVQQSDAEYRALLLAKVLESYPLKPSRAEIDARLHAGQGRKPVYTGGGR